MAGFSRPASVAPGTDSIATCYPRPASALALPAVRIRLQAHEKFELLFVSNTTRVKLGPGCATRTRASSASPTSIIFPSISGAREVSCRSK